jgi:hypothetical protein
MSSDPYGSSITQNQAITGQLYRREPSAGSLSFKGQAASHAGTSESNGPRGIDWSISSVRGQLVIS